jgi:hypothetical protein
VYRTVQARTLPGLGPLKWSRPMTQQTCPHLQAVGNPPSAPRPYPSHRHRCAAVTDNAVVAPRTQAHFCLVEGHATCLFYQAAQGAGAPAEPPGQEPQDAPPPAAV